MKSVLLILMLIISNITYAENNNKATRSPASQDDGCVEIQSTFGHYIIQIEGFYVSNCKGRMKYSPANPTSAKSYLNKDGGMVFIETQSAFGKFPESQRKIESKANIVRNGKTFSSLTVIKDKAITKRYLFEHQGKAVVGMSYINTETSEKYYIDGLFCSQQLPGIVKKFENFASRCNDFMDDIEKTHSALLARGNDSMDIALSGIVLKSKNSGSKDNFPTLKKLTELSQLCERYLFIEMPVIPPSLSSGSFMSDGIGK